MSRGLIFAGLALIAIGVLWPYLRQLPLGRLPGDIAIHRGNGSFYFPIATSIVLSVVLSLILWLFRR